MGFPLKMVIFHSYVSLPEGTRGYHDWWDFLKLTNFMNHPSLFTCLSSYQIWSIWIYPPKKIDLTPLHETSRESEAFQPIFPIQKMRFSPRSQGLSQAPARRAARRTPSADPRVPSRPRRRGRPGRTGRPEPTRCCMTWSILYIYILYRV